jgi:hypothetical protein
LEFPAYSAIALCNPFFDFGSKIVHFMMPAFKMAYRMNSDAVTMELKPDLDKIPDHIYPWLYDFENPF